MKEGKQRNKTKSKKEKEKSKYIASNEKDFIFFVKHISSAIMYLHRPEVTNC